MNAIAAITPVLGAVDKNAATYIWAIGAMVFILGGIGLGLIELIRVSARRTETVRLARGDEGPGYVSAVHESFQRPRVRHRLNAAWIVVGACGLIAVIALLINRA